MAPKFALFTKGSKLPLNQGFQKRFLVTTVSRQALDIQANMPNIPHAYRIFVFNKVKELINVQREIIIV